MKAKKKWKTWQKVLLGLGILILILAVAAAFLFFRYRSFFSSPRVVIGEPEDATIVQTEAGLVRGYLSDGVYTYHGIPYAGAMERFVPAEPVTPWKGIRDAQEYGDISPQAAILGMGSANTGEGTDNNCQNLNIWTPAVNDGGKRAVMVWLHGGGFSMGSANDSMYDGSALAKSQDVVIVGVNHRLNVFGHLNLSAYGEKYRYSANVGLTDIQMALSWIQANIEQFGGDPENITIFGQSGGGAKVLAMMTSPYARGLFQKGIVQSGATELMGVSFTSQEVSLALTEHILENLGITSDNIEEIQTVSPAELMRAADQALVTTGEEYRIPAPLSTSYGVEWGPVIDGDYLPTNPVTETGFAEAGRDVPLLIGSNFTEWTHWRSISVHDNMSQEQLAAFEAAYPERGSSDAKYVDTFIRLPMLKIMSHKADQGGANVYAYVFNYGSDPYHGYEIPFVFAHNSGAVGAAVSEAWASFAKTGVPSSGGLPDWEAYTRHSGATMIIDSNSRIVYHHDRDLMALLEPDYVY